MRFAQAAFGSIPGRLGSGLSICGFPVPGITHVNRRLVRYTNSGEFGPNSFIYLRHPNAVTPADLLMCRNIPAAAEL